MPQEIGQKFKTVIPTLADDSSIEEAFYMYHYGDAGWTQGQPIPSNSIEGAFSSLESRIESNESAIADLDQTYVSLSPASSTQNIIRPSASTTVSLSVRGATNQTANLQEWQKNDGTVLSNITANGSLALSGKLAVGGSLFSGLTNGVQIANSSHKGIVVRGAASQTANLQEWQDSNGNVLLSVDSGGSFVYNTPIYYEPLTATQSLPPQLITLSSTITSSKMGKIIEISNPDPDTAHTVTVPNNSSESIPIGGKISYISTNDGDIQFSPESGVTLNSENGYRKIDGKYSGVTLIKINTDRWILLGALKS